jgi:hypothetical protein
MGLKLNHKNNIIPEIDHHVIYKQTIVGTLGHIRYVERDFLRHANNAQKFKLMRQVGNDSLLPEECYM